MAFLHCNPVGHFSMALNIHHFVGDFVWGKDELSSYQENAHLYSKDAGCMA